MCVAVLFYTPSLLLNALLILLILLPNPFSVEKKWPRATYPVFLICLGLAIVAHEISFYNPYRLGYVINAFGRSYTIQTIKGMAYFLPLYLMAAKIILLALGVIILNRYFDLSALTWGAFIFMAAYMGSQSIRAEIFYRAFLRQQSDVTVPAFPIPASTNTTRKIILIHLCSLSTSDAEKSSFKNHPFWNNFDWVSWDFNAATSYSSVAVARIMNSLCGQARLKKFNQDHSFDDTCSVANFLETQNIQVNTIFDHNGKSFDLAHTANRTLGLPYPVPIPSGVIPAGTNYDGSPLYSDDDMLDISKNLFRKNSRQFIYYNMILLHQGVYITGNPKAWMAPIRYSSIPREKTYYQMKLAAMADSVETFIDNLEKKNTQALVILVGEHGYPLSAHWPQVSRFRDIPTKDVAIVPMAVRFTGLKRRAGEKAQVSEKSLSYFHLGWLLYRYVTEPLPSAENKKNLLNEIENISSAPYVAETEHWLVIERKGKCYFRNQKGWVWWKLP